MNDARPAEMRGMRQKHGNVNAVNNIASDKRHGSHRDTGFPAGAYCRCDLKRVRRRSMG